MNRKLRKVIRYWKERPPYTRGAIGKGWIMVFHLECGHEIRRPKSEGIPTRINCLGCHVDPDGLRSFERWDKPGKEFAPTSEHATLAGGVLLTLVKAAASLSVTPDALRLAISRGKLKADKYGRDWLVEDAEVERYRKENAGKQGRPRKPKPDGGSAPAT